MEGKGVGGRIYDDAQPAHISTRTVQDCIRYMRVVAVRAPLHLRPRPAHTARRRISPAGHFRRNSIFPEPDPAASHCANSP